MAEIHLPVVFHTNAFKVHLRCEICHHSILSNQYWLRKGCQIPGASCKLKDHPVHVDCWVNEHIEKDQCKNMEKHLLSEANTKNKRCFYSNCMVPEQIDKLRIHKCPLGGDECKIHDCMNANEYIHVHCWVNRHLYVCPVLHYPSLDETTR
jgi:hypothetical protein